MNNTNFGAFHPRLFLDQVTAATKRPPATPKGSLSQAELRRIVADMID